MAHRLDADDKPAGNRITIQRPARDPNSWKHAKGNAHSTSYTTYSHSDSGPIEFQVARQALDHTNDPYQNLDQLVGGIEFVNSNAKPLSDMIESYIEAGAKEATPSNRHPKR